MCNLIFEHTYTYTFTYIYYLYYIYTVDNMTDGVVEYFNEYEYCRNDVNLPIFFMAKDVSFKLAIIYYPLSEYSN